MNTPEAVQIRHGGEKPQQKNEAGLAQLLAEKSSSGRKAQGAVMANGTNGITDAGLAKKRAIFGSGKQIIGRTSMD